MATANCPDCGAFVDLVTIEGRGTIALDLRGSLEGEDRYRIKSFKTGAFEPVTATDRRWAYPAHRCLDTDGTDRQEVPQGALGRIGGTDDMDGTDRQRASSQGALAA